MVETTEGENPEEKELDARSKTNPKNNLIIISDSEERFGSKMESDEGEKVSN